MIHAGFSRIRSDVTKRAPRVIDSPYVDRVANKYISTLELIEDEEFAAGLARLRADVTQNGRLDRPMVWDAVVISGWTLAERPSELRISLN
jgi:hypothetical protein